MDLLILLEGVIFIEEHPLTAYQPQSQSPINWILSSFEINWGSQSRPLTEDTLYFQTVWL